MFTSSSFLEILIPIAWINDWISLLLYILSRRARSTFKILPLKGKIAWNILFLPCLAEPPAESPSTMYNSHFSGSLFEQSASLPGRVDVSRADFLLVNSLAFLAASRALCACKILSTISLANFGLNSSHSINLSRTASFTIGVTSAFPSFSFVCPSNSGFGILTETIAVKPSLISSPARFWSLSLIRLFFLA